MFSTGHAKNRQEQVKYEFVYQEVVDKCSSRKLDLNVLIDLAVYYIIPVQSFPNGTSVLSAENLDVISWWTSEVDFVSHFLSPSFIRTE